MFRPRFARASLLFRAGYCKIAAHWLIFRRPLADRRRSSDIPRHRRIERHIEYALVYGAY
jgi:hypothetical protein